MWKRIVSPSPESATRVPHKPNRPLNILLVVADDQPLGAMEVMTETARTTVSWRSPRSSWSSGSAEKRSRVDHLPFFDWGIPAIASAAVAGILLNLVFLILDDVIGRPEPTPPAPIKTEDAA